MAKSGDTDSKILVLNRLNLNKRSLFFIVLLSALLIVVMAFIFVRGSTAMTSAEIQKVIQIGDCKAALKKIGSRHANPDNSSDSIALLSFKSACELSLDRNKEAISTLEKLRPYYEEKSDTYMVRNVDDTIAYAKESLNNPPNREEKTPLNDPYLEAYLKENGEKR